MKEITTTGLICLRDELQIEYVLAKIEYTERADESFTYAFTPYYHVIELLSPPLFQGIPGLNLDLHKPVYIRENRIPVFISERTPGRNREDLWELLDEVGLPYLNPLEWLIRTDTRYSGDRLYVKRYTAGDEKHCVALEQAMELQRAGTFCKLILDVICRGDDVRLADVVIDDSNRKMFYRLLITMYHGETASLKMRRAEGIKRSAAKGNYHGRQRIQIDDTKTNEVFRAFHSKKLTEAEALERLGVSRATFYRRLKEFQMNMSQ